MDESQRLLQEILFAIQNGAGISAGNYSSAASSTTATSSNTTKQFATLNEALKRAQQAHEALTHNIQDHADEMSSATELQIQQAKNLAALTKSFKEGKITAEKYKQELQRLEHDVGSLSDVMGDLNDESSKALKKQIEKGKKDADAVKKYDDLVAKLKELTTVSGSLKVTFAAINAVGAAAGKFVTGLQSNASGMELSSGLMTASVEAVGGAGKMAGDAIGTVGGAMALAKGPIKFLGMAAMVAGPLLSGFSDSVSKLAKFGINVLQKEVEKTIKSFNEATSAGAMFADGMTGMRNASGDAGLTVEQFSSVLKSHSTVISQSGLGVAEGSKQIGRVAKDLKNSGVQAQLLNLGYSFEEQAGLIADTTANMRRTTGQRSTDAEIATETAKYAESLRTIAAITGEDAKRKAAEVQQQNQILAFQNEMAKKTPAQRAAIDAAMSTMTAIEQKNFRERAVLGNVINREGAIYESTVAGAREKGEAALALLQQNMLTAEANSKLNAQYGDQIKQSAESNQALAVAGMVTGGVVGDVAKAILDGVNQANIYTKEAVEKGAASVQNQKNTTDELTASVRNASIAVQGLAIDLQTALTPGIKVYAKVAEEILTGVKSQLESLGLGSKSSSKSSEDTVTEAGGSFWDNYGKDLAKVAGAAALVIGAGALTAATGGAAAPLLVAAASSAASVGASALAYSALDSQAEKIMSGPGKSIGGISSGPTTGYLEKLHGTELIIPMTGGALSTSSQGYADLMKAMDKTSQSSTSTTSLSSISNVSNISNQPYESTMASAVAAAIAQSLSPVGSIVSKLSSTMLNPSIPSPTLAGNSLSDLVSAISTAIPKINGPENIASMTAEDMHNTIADIVKTSSSTINDADESAPRDIRLITELKNISASITESIKTAALTLESQQQLVVLAGDQIRALEKLTRHVA